MNKFKKVVVGIVGAVAATSGNALAAVDLTAVDVDVTTAETLTATILIGLGVMWGIRKLIKTINRS